jgi:biogenesis AIM24-like protein
MNATIREGHAPAVLISLEAGEKLVSEAGAMMFISGDVAMDVEMPGGLMGGLKRAALSGESMFLATYEARGAGRFRGRSSSTSSTARSSASGTPTWGTSATSRSRARSRSAAGWASWAAARGSCSSG